MGQMSDALWKRPEDMLGVVCGQAILGSDYERFLKEYNIHPGDEGHFETYYRYQVNDHLAISPDLQVIHNIARSTESHTVTVFGIRGQIDFQVTSFRMVEIEAEFPLAYHGNR